MNTDICGLFWRRNVFAKVGGSPTGIIRPSPTTRCRHAEILPRQAIASRFRHDRQETHLRWPPRKIGDRAHVSTVDSSGR